MTGNYTNPLQCSIQGYGRFRNRPAFGKSTLGLFLGVHWMGYIWKDLLLVTGIYQNRKKNLHWPKKKEPPSDASISKERSSIALFLFNYE